MRAVVCDHYGPWGEMQLTEAPSPAIAAGQVRIAVHYAAVAFATALVVAGKYQRKPPLPFSPGTEVSGIVTAVGAGVTGFRVGDRVAAALDWGGLAEEAIATAATTYPVPEGVSLRDAVSVPLSYGTSHAALHWRAHIRAGETLVVFGAAGGVGLTAVQVGRLAGARVIAVAGTRERADIAVANGAHVGLVHTEGELASRIRAANGGVPVDLVYDPVGEPLFAEALRVVRPEGRIVLIGFASGNVPAIPANLLLVKNIDVIGFNFGWYVGWGLTDERERFREPMQAMVAGLMAAVARGDLKPPGEVTFPLRKFVEAFDTIAARRSIGRVVLTVVDDAAA